MSLRSVTLLLALVALEFGASGLGPVQAQAPAGERAGPTENPAVAEPGSLLRIWLVTAGPGDAVWERYGHNAIRVLDTATGRDVAYNWGIFDFEQVDFIPRFLRGRMLYMMAPFQSQSMLAAYARVDREVVVQELDLTPAQKLELRDLAERNALPENRDYAYQYFLDNCSTRVRDLLDLVLGGSLRAEFESSPGGVSFRDHIRRLTQDDPLIFTGMDLLLGAPGDRPEVDVEAVGLGSGSSPCTLRTCAASGQMPRVNTRSKERNRRIAKRPPCEDHRRRSVMVLRDSRGRYRKVRATATDDRSPRRNRLSLSDLGLEP